MNVGNGRMSQHFSMKSTIKFYIAVSVGAKSKSEQWSVNMRLISSRAHQGFSCLLAMRARTNTKVVVRHRYLKIAKYAIRHVDIIVLPGVDNHFIVALS